MATIHKTVLALAILHTASWLRADNAGADFFEAKIRPILVANCEACHGKTALSGLRVDSREALLKGGTMGPAIVPGDPEHSLLIHGVRQDGDLKMPKGSKLKAAEIADLSEWIKMGAPWPDAKAVETHAAETGIAPERRNFWSFQPLKKPPAPAVKDVKWARNEIDRFILARLEAEGMKPAPQANKRTLIRRVYYDLIGLPPTPEQVDAFVKDVSPDAYPKLIDQLLASPKYGEKWGRHWLDVARFGEDDMRGLARRGFEPYDSAYLYRDWVIRAFNEDMPFPLFVKAQLAADQLDDTIRAKMLPALGFLGQGPWYYDTNEPSMARADERHERVDTVTRSMLGLTVGCARCHDHKYDPITTRDYYSFAGIIANTTYHEYPLAPKKVVDTWTAENKKLKALQKMVDEFSRNVSAELAEVLALQAEKYMVAAWNISGAPKKTLAEASAEAKVDQEVLDRWVGFLAKPPTYYPYLIKWQAMVAAGGTVEEARTLAKEFQSLLVDVINEKREVDEKNRKIIAKGMPLDPKPSVILPNDFDSFFDRPQLDLDSMPVERLNLWTNVFQRDIFGADTPDPAQGKPGLLSFRGYSLERQISPQSFAHLDTLRKEIDARRKALPKYPFVHGVEDVAEPKDLRIHLRGSPYNLGDATPRRFLEVLSGGVPKPYNKGSGRLELAESIAGTPIAARVFANRIWKWHFGTGLVETTSNFGQTGERPSHPELLDYLAQSLVDNGWSVKKLHREILLSATYQLGDAADQANFAKDPQNRFHWRGSRRRLDAEEIRDSMLSVAGALDETPGGPSFDVADDKNTRRTVYGRVSRFKLDTFLQVFDFPSAVISCESRLSTNVPLQRLYFLNSEFVYQESALLAKRIAAEVGDENKIKKAYHLVYQREATAEELAAGLAFIAKEREKPAPAAKPSPQATPDSASSLVSKPDTPATPAVAPMAAKADASPRPRGARGSVPPALDVWAVYVRVLYSSNEFLYLD